MLAGGDELLRLPGFGNQGVCDAQQVFIAIGPRVIYQVTSPDNNGGNAANTSRRGLLVAAANAALHTEAGERFRYFLGVASLAACPGDEGLIVTEGRPFLVERLE